MAWANRQRKAVGSALRLLLLGHMREPEIQSEEARTIPTFFSLAAALTFTIAATQFSLRSLGRVCRWDRAA
jgi:hypothetical protein